MKPKETKFIINSIDDLITLGESNVLTPSQFVMVLQSSDKFIGIFLNDYENTIEMARVLKDFWSEWKHTNEKPIFLDNVID
jgi:hypothetical protein